MQSPLQSGKPRNCLIQLTCGILKGQTTPGDTPPRRIARVSHDKDKHVLKQIYVFIYIYYAVCSFICNHLLNIYCIYFTGKNLASLLSISDPPVWFSYNCIILYHLHPFTNLLDLPPMSPPQSVPLAWQGE